MYLGTCVYLLYTYIYICYICVYIYVYIYVYVYILGGARRKRDLHLDKYPLVRRLHGLDAALAVDGAVLAVMCAALRWQTRRTPGGNRGQLPRTACLNIAHRTNKHIYLYLCINVWIQLCIYLLFVRSLSLSLSHSIHIYIYIHV